MLPEWREDLERLAALVLNRPRFVQQAGIEAFDFETGSVQHLFHFRIARDDGGFVAAIPKHRVAPVSLTSDCNVFEHRAAPDHEPRTEFAQSRRQAHAID